MENNAPIKIITAVVNNPVFIEIQYHTLKKYFKSGRGREGEGEGEGEGEDEGYEFIVFNDAKDFPDFTNGNDPSIRTQIQQVCAKLNITCINIPNSHHTRTLCAAIRCADSMNFILKYQKEHPAKYLLLDSDMFLIDDFDIRKYSAYDCAIVLQSRNNHTTHYFWNGIYYFDMTKMKHIELLNWNCCMNCDVGIMMQEWLQLAMKGSGAEMPNTDDIRRGGKVFHTDTIYFIRHLWSCSWNADELPRNLLRDDGGRWILDFLENDVRNVNGKFFCEIYDDVFLHYRAGGNWMNEGLAVHRFLTQSLKDCLLG
jgi:hypothetical protein